MALALHDNQPILHVRGGGERSVECGAWSVEQGARRERESVQQGAVFFIVRLTTYSPWLQCCFVL